MAKWLLIMASFNYKKLACFISKQINSNFDMIIYYIKSKYYFVKINRFTFLGLLPVLISAYTAYMSLVFFFYNCFLLSSKKRCCFMNIKCQFVKQIFHLENRERLMIDHQRLRFLCVYTSRLVT